MFGVGHQHWILSSKIGRGRGRKGNLWVIIVLKLENVLKIQELFRPPIKSYGLIDFTLI